MPHIIVEYAEQLFDDSEIQILLDVMHRSISDSGLFEEGHIKTRAYPFNDFTNAGKKNPYIHVQARIKSGRDADNKKALGKEILAGLKTLDIQASVVTVEIIDMDRESYAKYVP